MMKKKFLSVIMFLSFMVILGWSHTTYAAVDTYTALIPPMTTTLNSVGTANASSSYDGLPAWKAFDGKKAYSISNEGYTAWGTPNTTGWLGFEFNQATVVSKYTIYYGASASNRVQSSDTSTPKTWTFEASNDNKAWTILDTQSNIIDWKNITAKEQVLDNKLAYKFYRLNITANNGNTQDSVKLTIHEMQLFSKDAPVMPTNVTAKADQATSSIKLTWDALQNATGYNIKRATNTGGPYETIASNVTEATYSDTKVDEDQTYYYVVSAILPAGESYNSKETNAKLTIEVTTPTSGRVLLVITMVNGLEKEYDLSATEYAKFVSWYDAKANGTGSNRYTFNKTWNKGPFKTRTENVVYDKIITFDANEY